MAGIGRFKLSDAIRDQQAQAEVGQSQGPWEGGVPVRKGKGKGRGRSKATGEPSGVNELAAEQIREARESSQAKNAEASTRDRMVDIGRGNQQAGRQRAK